jgi:hypothetical protein
MSENYLKKAQAKTNLNATTSKIKFVKEKLTALLIVLCLLFVVIKCVQTKQTKPLGTTEAGVNDVQQGGGKTNLVTDAPKVTKPVVKTGDEEVDPVNGDSTAIIPKAVVKTGDVTVSSGAVKPVPPAPDKPAPPAPKPPVKPSVEEINVDLKVSGNTVSWNPKLTDATDEIKISFIDEKRRTWVPRANYSGNVTGKSSYTYSPGDGKAGDIATTVEISYTLKKGYKLVGRTKIKNQYFKCSDSGDK